MEIQVPTMRLVITEYQNTLNRAFDLVLEKEKSDEALRRKIVQKKSVEDYYNKVVRFKSFSVENWVL